MNRISFVLAVFALPTTAFAQWTDDPAANTPVAVTAGDQVQSKIVPTSDGGAYISWFSQPGGGYDVRLQRLSAAGEPQWPVNGILIADRSFSSTQDYGLAVDAQDHALLSFRDDRFTGIQVTATRVSPAGMQVWGDSGVQLTNTTDFIAAPRIAALSDGRIAVAWTQAATTRIDVLNGGGVSVLRNQIVLSDSPGTANLSLSDLKAADDDRAAGNFVVLWIRQQGGAGARQLHTRAYTSSGKIAWNHGPLFAAGSVQQGNFPTFVSDGHGGAVYSWYLVGPLQCFAQWVDHTGAAQWGANGLALSTNATRIRVSPSLAFNPNTMEAYAFWTEQNTLQSQHGLYGQRVNSLGARLWTDNGLEIIALSATPITQVRAHLFPELVTAGSIAGGGAAVFYSEDLGFNNQRLHGARLDMTGAHLWSPNFIDVSSAPSGKSRLAVTGSTQGFAMLTWGDGRNDSSDIFAQSVLEDGALGPLPPRCALADIDCNGLVNGIDLGILLSQWFNPGTADLDGDGDVDGVDLGILLANWTP